VFGHCEFLYVGVEKRERAYATCRGGTLE
jgi:hypothetical protein